MRPPLNTLFVDKNLRFHGLMQAYSRTNRIFDATKTFGNIVTFRDLEQATIDAITLFGDKNTKNVVLEKSYQEYMEGFTDAATGEARRGFMDVVARAETRFPDPAAIEKEADKKPCQVVRRVFARRKTCCKTMTNSSLPEGGAKH